MLVHLIGRMARLPGGLDAGNEEESGQGQSPTFLVHHHAMLEAWSLVRENTPVKRKRKTLCLCLGVLIVALPACKTESPPAREEGPKSVSRAAFKPGEVRAINPSDRPEAQGKASEEVPKVLSLLNEFYSTAFLDPKKWSGGTHAGLAELFTQEARPHLGPNLGALALADLAPGIEGLIPGRQDIPRMSFFVDDDLSTPFAVVTTVFEAKATPSSGKTPIAVVHHANFSVTREGDNYKIYAYSAELRADSQTKSTAFGDPARESIR